MREAQEGGEEGGEEPKAEEGEAPAEEEVDIGRVLN